jgi:hypothetical protein
MLRRGVSMNVGMNTGMNMAVFSLPFNRKNTAQLFSCSVSGVPLKRSEDIVKYQRIAPKLCAHSFSRHRRTAFRSESSAVE